MKRFIPVFAIMLAVPFLAGAADYEASWESLDTRPTPAWFDEARFGIFIHWGVYSVPAWAPKDTYSEWYWKHMENKESPTWQFHVKTYGKDFAYQDFAPMFKAELFDPAEWADVFARSGARYIVLTSKHHDGFCLWPSPDSWNWNAVDVGPHRDLLGDLTTAVRERGLRMGYYYSLYEWFNPIYRSDPARYVNEHMLPQMKDLVERYRPDILWGDGEWDRPSTEWRTPELLAWLFNESSAPDDIAINDRWGKDTRSKHGGFYTTEYGRYHKMDAAKGRFSWEECRGMGMSFGYNRNESADDYRSATELIHLLIDTVSRGGNLLLDIGPTEDGRIPVVMQERLLAMGKWLGVNGDAIYGTRKWRETGEGDGDLVRYTTDGDAVYAICLRWPESVLTLSVPEPDGDTAVHLLGSDKTVQAAWVDGGLAIRVPDLSVNDMPCDHAYIFRLTGVK